MLRLSARLIFLWVAAGIAACPARLDAADFTNQDCLDCHSELSAEHFAKAVHGQNLCTSCHKGITELPHDTPLAKVDCGSCHRIESQIYLASDHGRAHTAGAPAAICGDCHGDPHVFPDTRNPASPVSRHNIAKTCAVCHEDQKKMAPYDLLEKTPYQTYLQTVHGSAMEKGVLNSATCTDCHGSHDLHAPTNPESKIHRSKVPETCGKCHENVLRTYQHSIHGRAAAAGKVEAPICTDCHGEHTILSHWNPASKTYTTSVSEKVCASCHAAERITSKYRLPSDRLKTYNESFHGLSNRYGVTTVANCASCHGAHDVLPSSDPASSVHKQNLAQTCGKCHPNASDQLMKGSMHLAPSHLQDQAVYFVTLFYWVLIIGVIGLMLFHNGLDFWTKLRAHYRKKLASPYVRFTKGERIQHALLVWSFVILAYTGFALKWPEAWWALPITAASGQFDWRALIHRIAAVVFTLTGVYHLFYAAFTARGRGQVRAMWPSWKDWHDVKRNMAYYFGRSREKAHFGRYGYVEKAEYWALIWGAFIMIATGALLWFSDWSLRELPKWTLDVATAIHFYEALLATLAIVVWHFYFVIFDPDQYPMNWSMMTGKSDHGEPEKPSGDKPSDDNQNNGSANKPSNA